MISTLMAEYKGPTKTKKSRTVLQLAADYFITTNYTYTPDDGWVGRNMY
jgi:hypothetical protein